MFKLKGSVELRPYQKHALDHVFVNNQAKSGIIVLPCGAGKTLFGVAAAARLKKTCIVLCTNAVSVEELKKQFVQWTNLKCDQVQTFTSNSKMKFTDSCVVITTFSMMGVGKRSDKNKRTIDAILEREWGLLLLDEVHVAPADTFKKAIEKMRSECKLGLTATLVREDEKIVDLDSLVGPKLYEASCEELMKAGYIATTHCTEVKCQMTDAFASAYSGSSSGSSSGYQKKLLSVMNPNKFRACQHLIESLSHNKNNKIIVFSDNIWAMEVYAKKLGKPLIDGKTPHQERMQVIDCFQKLPHFNTIFLSKIGDNSLNIPEANILIQISSHAGSRRQEAQRLGRISRAKNGGGGEAFFYTLVSMGTEEEEYSSKRRQFLVDNGYEYKDVAYTDLVKPTETQYHYSTEAEQEELLNEVLKARSEEEEEEEKEEHKAAKKPKKSSS